MPTRADVLELLAEELGARAAHPLASFTTWDGDGRRKLDGMSRGRRWDIDRELREEKRATEKLIGLLRWKRWYAKNKGAFAAYRKRWGQENKEKERAYGRLKHKRRRKDPKRWAVFKARQARHLPKKLARAKERYWADVEASRARNRAASARYYLKRKREGTRRCSTCGQPGHNRRRCGASLTG
jgi:hypothetical protein